MDFLFPAAPDAFSLMLKPIGPWCNLDCTYCYYLEKKNLYQGKAHFKLEGDLLEVFIKQYIEAHKVPGVSFVWQGGEPTLLGLEYFRKALAIQKKYAGEKQIENSLQTNGTLLTDDLCKFFSDNNFLLGISIDGPEHLHDYYRLDKQGHSTWDKVMQGIALLNKHRVEFNTLSVVNRRNAEFPLEVYHFLKGIGSRFLQFIPIVEREALEEGFIGQKLVHQDFPNEAGLTDWSLKPGQLGEFNKAIFDEWVRKDVGQYYIQLFDVALANWFGAPPGLCVFSETCGNAAVMEHNGDVYSCDHFVYKDHLLGNISEKPLQQMMGSTQQTLFGQAKKATLTRYCKQCSFRFACHGDCPKHRFMKTPSGEKGLSYLCGDYKAFFSHVKPYMDFIVKELKAQRPPANVMEWARIRDMDAVPHPRKPGRNDPCPCGSGKKLKHCHPNG